MGKRVAIIGGGAAGCFCAIELKRQAPDADVTVMEAQPRLMAKLSITGGGRCNLTNTFSDAVNLKDVYPRGEKLVRQAFRVFSPRDTVQWWEREGVRLVVEDGGRVFPRSGKASQIVDKLAALIRELGVKVECRSRVQSVKDLLEDYDFVVVTTGGGTLSVLDGLPEVKTEKTVPSLFTFRIDDPVLKALMGTVVEDVTMSLASTKLHSRGDLLITDWGVSGPATLKLSSYAARYLDECGYRADLIVNYLSRNEEQVRKELDRLARENPQKFIINTPAGALSARLWEYLVGKAALRRDQRWAELGSKGLNRLAAILTADSFRITGRCRFKDEFVTAGGVSASEVNASTLESRHCPGLYFAGEMLDIDAVTGGFNLQAAWSTAVVVARAIANSRTSC
jgi:predicted Rossmann fold flavoprotein